MQTVNTQFETALRKRMAERVEELKDQLAAGLLDHEAYKHTCGQIVGIHWVETICNEVAEDLAKR